MSEISRSGLYRFSPAFKKKEIGEAIDRLLEVDRETWVCLVPLSVVGRLYLFQTSSTRAEEIFEQREFPRKVQETPLP